jgi:hypothetical protein
MFLLKIFYAKVTRAQFLSLGEVLVLMQRAVLGESKLYFG